MQQILSLFCEHSYIHFVVMYNVMVLYHAPIFLLVNFYNGRYVNEYSFKF